MKKALMLTLAAGLALTACERAPKPESLTEMVNSRLESATTLADSIIAIDGTFIGAAYASQVDMQGIENPDRNEMLRGLRDVLGADADNQSYLAGIAMGMQVMNVYRDLAADEEISKEKFLATIAAAFRLDSISQQELQDLQPRFQQTFETVKQRAQERRDAEIYKTESAAQNRIIGDAIAEKLQADPDFAPAGPDGLMVRVLTPGSGEVINPNTIIVASISEQHADSRHAIRSLGETPMYAGRPNHPVLSAVLPYMSVGETAEFFVPYKLAYGVAGDENLGIGPCESIICTVTVKPYSAE